MDKKVPPFQVENLDLLMHQVKAGVVIHRPDTSVAYANPSALEILGITLEALQKTVAHERDWDFLYPDGETMAAKDYPVNLVLATRRPLEGLVMGIEHHDKAGPTWVRVAGFPEFDAHGNLKQIVISFIDITEHVLLKETVLRDDLTNLVSRNLFYDRLKKVLHQNARTGNRTAVLFVDVDRFKRINDLYGHDIGDQVLIEIAQRIRNVMRPVDTVGRLGGDEFLVLVPYVTELDDLWTIADKIVRSISCPLTVHNCVVSVSVSVGIAIDSGGTLTEEDIIRHADQAMYRAKSLGKNGYQIFSEDMEQALQSSLAMEYGLKNGIENGEFVLHYQPKFGLKTGRLNGFEALLRWQQKGAGLIYPDEFISIAERSGLILPIGEFVFERVCEDLKIFQSENILPEGARISFNVSEKQFSNVNLFQQFQRCLQSHQVDPNSLELEITETVLMQSFQQSTFFLQKLKDIGIITAIDDFGTGYSSLNYLKHLPISVLKIDKTFIADIPIDKSDMAIASAVVVMGHELGLHVVAEGVESQAQLAFLKEIECDTVQGYLTGKPMAVEQVLQTFAQPVLER